MSLDLSALGRWMDEQGLPGGDLDARLLSGGTQKILARVTRGGATYVLRRPPLRLRAKSNENLLREARVLGALTGDAASPALVGVCADTEVPRRLLPADGGGRRLQPGHGTARAARERSRRTTCDGAQRRQGAGPPRPGRPDWMRDFVRDELWPIDAIEPELSVEQLDALLKPLKEQVKARGLWAAHLDPEHGGLGFGQVKLGLMQEIIGTSYVGMVAFGCQAPDSGNSEILAIAGTDAQKKQWLEPLLAGDLRSCFSMTEPNTAGSDPTLLSTRATKDGDEWVINGRKWFSSNASVADFLIVMAATDPEAAPHRRASMFVVPVSTPGVRVVRDVPTMGHPHETFGQWGGHAEVTYDDVRVPADALLGGLGDGFAIAQQRLGPGRIHHCMRWLGQAQRALDMLCEYATHRYAHGSLLGDKGTVQAWIADSAAEIQAARLMTLHAAWKIDTQGVAAARQDIAMIKYFGAPTRCTGSPSHARC